MESVHLVRPNLGRHCQRFWLHNFLASLSPVRMAVLQGEAERQRQRLEREVPFKNVEQQPGEKHLVPGAT